MRDVICWLLLWLILGGEMAAYIHALFSGYPAWQCALYFACAFYVAALIEPLEQSDSIRIVVQWQFAECERAA